jgi:hypothetical protein
MRCNMLSGQCMEIPDEATLGDRGIAYMALIDAGILVRTERNNRRLVRWAAGYRIRAERGDANLSIPLQLLPLASREASFAPATSFNRRSRPLTQFWRAEGWNWGTFLFRHAAIRQGAFCGVEGMSSDSETLAG